MFYDIDTTRDIYEPKNSLQLQFFFFIAENVSENLDE